MNRHVLVAPLLMSVLGVAAIVSAQAPRMPARDPSARSTGTAIIRGRIIVADSGAAVRRAIVRLASPEIGGPRSRVTDAEGRYEFRDLPAGNYSITASKNGFITGAAGAVRPEDAAKAVKLAAGQVASADVVLARAGAIAGRVVDEFGDPASDIQVTVLRSQSVGRTRRLVSARVTQTDDLGQFRAHGLTPGTYFVAARAAAFRDAESEDHTGYAPTYYPAAASVSQAQPVRVSVGQDATGVEIMLIVARVARIAGVAFESRGRPPVNASISAKLVDPAFTSSVSTTGARILPNGSFVINGLPPGDYLLEMRVSADPSRPGAAQEYGFARVSVAGADVDGVSIQSLPGATIAGQVVFERGAPSLKAPMTVAATVAAANGASPPPSPLAQVSPDGRFLLSRVFGANTLRVSGTPAGWALKAIYVDGRDVIDTPIMLDGRERIAGVQIVLTDRLTRVTATVNDERGQPVDAGCFVVLPDDLARFQPESRFVRVVPLSSGGAPLRIDGLPAGDYIGFALKSAPAQVDVWDPTVFEYARSVGTRFSLLDGDVKDLALTVVQPPAKQ